MLGTTIASGRLTLVIITALAEFDSDLNVERIPRESTSARIGIRAGRVTAAFLPREYALLGREPDDPLFLASKVM